MTAAPDPRPTDRDDGDDEGVSSASEEKSNAMRDADVANGENPAE